MYVYEISSIDFWNGWQSEEDYKTHIKISPCPRCGHVDFDVETDRWHDYLVMKKRAFQAAHKLHWEGDIRRGDLYVTGLPSDGESLIAIAWKQENNGTTFVATPYRMPWLETVPWGLVHIDVAGNLEIIQDAFE